MIKTAFIILIRILILIFVVFTIILGISAKGDD